MPVHDNSLSLYHFELQVPIDTQEGGMLVSSLMSDRANTPILKGAGQVRLLDDQYSILVVVFLKQAVCCSFTLWWLHHGFE